jgi:hypothetical protein
VTRVVEKWLVTILNILALSVTFRDTGGERCFMLASSIEHKAIESIKAAGRFQVRRMDDCLGLGLLAFVGSPGC